MNKLTPEQLVLLNRKIIADDEASVPQVKFDDLKEITEIPYQKNEELFYIYRTAIEKAAKLGHLIVLRKPFVKANQETAVLALLTLLDINGYKMVNYSKDIEEKIQNAQTSSSASAGGEGGSDRDEIFEQAAKFIIEKDKASIGMLQRMFKIGFNRAARIMDQLCDYGVVGEEEGTKPRKVLMSMEQFEQLLEEI